MSVQAISWAMDHRVHSVTEKVILLVLANYANEYGISWPSQRTLADDDRPRGCADRLASRGERAVEADLHPRRGRAIDRLAALGSRTYDDFEEAGKASKNRT
jgi:hypothetical protein